MNLAAVPQSLARFYAAAIAGALYNQVPFGAISDA
jgi:hypothetical protein